MTRGHHEAEEVVQDAFLSLFEHWARMESILDPVGYLHTTAFNVWKKRSRRAARALRHVFASTPEADAFEAADARTVLGAALDQLTPRCERRSFSRISLGSRRTRLPISSVSSQ